MNFFPGPHSLVMTVFTLVPFFPRIGWSLFNSHSDVQVPMSASKSLRSVIGSPLRPIYANRATARNDRNVTPETAPVLSLQELIWTYLASTIATSSSKTAPVLVP